MNTNYNKRKIINDPVHGLITIPSDLVFDLIEHPWFQRLRRIKQLGLTHYVYPSAVHNRFQHAIGCLHLMKQAIDVLRTKGQVITEDEEEGVLIAILLHDIGHGPFSHTLEETIVKGVSHEDLSVCIMDELNRQFGGRLSTAQSIFLGLHPKKFLHQLVSSQLDMDRLDYLSRDSFFTGVAEGVINTDRIIKMLTVADDELLVEGKAIYSIEKFIVARRLMYWQVYLHKTVVAAEYMMINVLRRARQLVSEGTDLFASPALTAFLGTSVTLDYFYSEPAWLEQYARLDDDDIFSAIKVWTQHPDPVLSNLSRCLIDRRLYKAILQQDPFDPAMVDSIRSKVMEKMGILQADLHYFVIEDTVSNNAYHPTHDRIRILHRNREIQDISEASDQLNIAILQKTVSKHLLCFPKSVIN